MVQVKTDRDTTISAIAIVIECDPRGFRLNSQFWAPLRLPSTAPPTPLLFIASTERPFNDLLFDWKEQFRIPIKEKYSFISLMSVLGNPTNIFWHDCPVGRQDRQQLLNQKGCVVWITGLSGSGKSTLACSLGRELHTRGKLSYILDGDNLRHGLNKDLGFKAEDRVENIRRVGEVAKLFSDSGLICIASLISPYRKDRDACRAILPDGSFFEVYMNIPLEVCEERDAKGLYKLARAGKIKGFTGIDDPYEAPLDSEIELGLKDGICPTPCEMATQVASYLDDKGFLHC